MVFIKGKQLANTLRSESSPFDAIHSDKIIGDLNGAVRFTAVNNVTSADNLDTIGAYKVVYITGQSGNLPTIGLADADSSSMPAFGLTVRSSDYQEEVDVITFGNLKGVDTSSLSVGDVLYVSTTAGEYTTTPPAGTGSKIQNIGMVVKSDSNGIIKVGGAGRSNATPNLDEGHFFLGNASNRSAQSAYQLPTSLTGTSGQVLASDGTDLVLQASSSPSAATETVAGVIEIATDAEATAASANSKALVPSNIQHIYLSSFNNDLSYLSSGDNVSLLSNDANYLVNLSEDSTPQLGADLDTNDNEIVTALNRNLILRPNGTGRVQLGGNTNPAEIRLNCDTNDSHYVGLKSPTHSEMGANPSVTYRLPITDAANSGDALVSDGQGRLSFTTISGGGYTFDPISSNTNAQVNYHYSCDTSGGAFTLTLPALSGVAAGQEIRIKLATAGNDLTIARTGTDTIEGVSSNYVLSVAKSAITLVANVQGTDWEII